MAAQEYANFIGEAGSEADQKRLAELNRSGPWAIAHRKFLVNLKEEVGIKPTRHLELSVGSDATLVINTIDIFGDSLEEVVLFDINATGLEGARETLRNKQAYFDDHHVRLVFGDEDESIANTIPNNFRVIKITTLCGDVGNLSQFLGELGEFDLINAQLLLQHLSVAQRVAMMYALPSLLRERGIFTLGDVIFGDWYVRSPIKPEKAATLNGFIQKLQQRIWGGKTTPDTAGEWGRIIEEGSQQGLGIIRSPLLSRTTIIDDASKHGGARSALVGMVRQITKGTDLEEEAEQYLDAMNDPAVVVVYPSFIEQAYHSNAQS